MTNLNLLQKIKGWQFCQPSFFTVVLVLLLLSACNQTENSKPQIYEGPISEGEDVDMLYSEKENITIKVKAKKVREFQNGDRQFPEGIFIEFFNEQGIVTSTLRTNSAFYYKAEDKWKGVGKVEVKNIEKNEQLNTEELFWFPAKKTINTDKFVQIRTGKEVIYGTGLEAKQDMSEYSIRKVEGEFTIDD